MLHGNGNEAVGIDMFFDAIEDRAQDLADGAIEPVSPVLALPEID